MNQVMTAQHEKAGTKSREARWREIDWAMKALSLAAHQCTVAGLPHVTEDLLRLHEVAARERDRA